jgi:hypothetical protein
LKSILWKTHIFLWITWGKLVENSEAFLTTWGAIGSPVEKRSFSPQVFHTLQVTLILSWYSLEKLLHIFHRLYYYLISLKLFKDERTL